MNRLGHLHLWARKKVEALDRLQWCWPGDAADMSAEQLGPLLGNTIPENAKRNIMGRYSVQSVWLETQLREEALARYQEDIGRAPRYGLYMPPTFGQIREWMERVATTPPQEWGANRG